jgi:hypothetical protein
MFSTLGINKFLNESRTWVNLKVVRPPTTTGRVPVLMRNSIVVFRCSRYDENRHSNHGCTYNQNQAYVVFSAMGSFFLPLIVVVYVYLKISCVIAERHNKLEALNGQKLKVNIVSGLLWTGNVFRTSVFRRTCRLDGHFKIGYCRYIGISRRKSVFFFSVFRHRTVVIMAWTSGEKRVPPDGGRWFVFISLG